MVVSGLFTVLRLPFLECFLHSIFFASSGWYIGIIFCTNIIHITQYIRSYNRYSYNTVYMCIYLVLVCMENPYLGSNVFLEMETPTAELHKSWVNLKHLSLYMHVFRLRQTGTTGLSSRITTLFCCLFTTFASICICLHDRLSLLSYWENGCTIMSILSLMFILGILLVTELNG